MNLGHVLTGAVSPPAETIIHCLARARWQQAVESAQAGLAWDGVVSAVGRDVFLPLREPNSA